jgi:hypothetical protein
MVKKLGQKLVVLLAMTGCVAGLAWAALRSPLIIRAEAPPRLALPLRDDHLLPWEGPKDGERECRRSAFVPSVQVANPLKLLPAGAKARDDSEALAQLCQPTEGLPCAVFAADIPALEGLPGFPEYAISYGDGMSHPTVLLDRDEQGQYWATPIARLTVQGPRGGGGYAEGPDSRLHGIRADGETVEIRLGEAADYNPEAKVVSAAAHRIVVSRKLRGRVESTVVGTLDDELKCSGPSTRARGSD